MDKTYFRICLILILVVFAGLLFVSKASAAVTLTPATGGTNVSIDTTSYSGGTSAWTTLTGPVIAENINGDIGSSTTAHVLTLPAGWEFNTTVGQWHAIVTGTMLLGATSTTANTMSFVVSATSSIGTLSTLTFSGIQVKPTGTATSTVNITQTTGIITGITNGDSGVGTSLGLINSVVGAVNNLNIYQAPVVGATVDNPFNTQPIISVIDRFGNGVGSQNVVASVGSGTGTLFGTLTQTSNGNGSTTFSGLGYGKSGETFTINFAVGGVSTTSAALGPLSAGAAASLSVETAVDGSGTTVPSQNLNSGSAITAYSITRDQYSNFVANAAADAWSLASKTGNVVDTDLVAASDSKSAVMTGHNSGTATIHATKAGLTAADSGTITVSACSPYSVSDGSVGSYPTCAITCNAGYYLTGSSCSLIGGGGVFSGILLSSPTYSSGSLLRASNSDKVYLIDNGEKRWIPTGEIFNANGYSWANVKVVASGVISGYTEGANVQQATTLPPWQTIPEGGLIRANGDVDVYIVKYVGSKKFKRLILNPSIFNSYKHLKWRDIKDVGKSVADSFTVSDLVRAVNDFRVYKLYPAGDTGEKRWIETAAVFTSLGYNWDSVYEINQTDRDSYKTGQTLK
ncbi:MAG: hypothetical protein CO159_02730 [Candidatus Portnoybacteria bacterium CG_4_9_14_3_um_filter_40_10]|uniref:BIG2 domain-containing protein n=1 Tax=Candidatus Portnoybacteria bacterium CG_4_9_14_3_um_filter_40_10 TaxID=1974804 RepID=A0A2M7YNF4_9BACT|nr:MAG: hypothetical protein CO159_02730 [Candidatus Portnoybacteria bacterium CG_4_9_14_3_um_filter_40_10]